MKVTLENFPFSIYYYIYNNQEIKANHRGRERFILLTIGNRDADGEGIGGTLRCRI